MERIHKFKTESFSKKTKYFIKILTLYRPAHNLADSPQPEQYNGTTEG